MSDERPEPAGVSVLDVIKMSEDGLILQKVSSIEECLDGSPAPASTLRDIFTRIDVTLQNDETLQEWVSELVEKVAANQQWLKDQETDLEQWRDMFPAIVESAKKGKNLRNKRREDLKVLLAMGVGGPRFERLLETSSRNFLNGVRREVVLHGFSYPLVCCLANVKTYHRLIGHSRGVQKTRYTQPVDLSQLDSVAYRELTDNELAAAGVAIGPAGFLVPLEADPGSPVRDADFDKAVASFQPGLRGAQQPVDHGKVEPTPNDKPEESLARPKKFLVKHDAFPFAPSCDCAAGVDEELKASIDNIQLGVGFEAVQSISQQLLASIDMLCARHCQLALVYGLGSDELKDKSNAALLRTQLASDVEALVAYIRAKPRAKDEYSSFKAALGGFSWAKVADFAKTNGRARAKRKTRK
ncbi:hypothetical protein LQW54_005798 [Pestalotiopsis sp. IQ-011]